MSKVIERVKYAMQVPYTKWLQYRPGFKGAFADFLIEEIENRIVQYAIHTDYDNLLKIMKLILTLVSDVVDKLEDKE